MLAYALHEGSVAISLPHLLVNVPPIVLVWLSVGGEPKWS